MKLYSAKGANSPRKVLIFIAEKNISDIEVVNLDLMQGEHKSPEYRAIAPNAKVPALVLVNRGKPRKRNGNPSKN